jgi:hypothetical protein
MKNKDLVGSTGCIVAAAAMVKEVVNADGALTTILAGALALVWLLAGLALLIEHVTEGRN